MNNNDNEYVIKDYSLVTKQEINNMDHHNLKVYVVDEKEMFTWLDKAKNDETIKISVYKLGDWVLDWS